MAITINYLTSTSNFGYPIILKEIVDDSGQVLSSEDVSFLEAELSGYDMEEYFSAYKSYIQTYANSLTAYVDESELSERESHMAAMMATRHFTDYMAPKWSRDYVDPNPNIEP